MRTSLLLGLSLLLLAASPAVAADSALEFRADAPRHSGTIVAIDKANGTITINEQGPWRGEGTGVHRVTFQLRPEVNVMLIERTAGSDRDGWPGSFTSSKLSPSDLRVGDVVTLKAERLGTGSRMAVVSLEVTRPTAKDAEGRTEVPAASPSLAPSK